MNNVIVLKRSSLRRGFVEATMFLKLYMSLIPNNPMDVTESPILNTLIPSRLELLDDIDDSDDDDDDDDEEEEEDLSPMPVKSDEADFSNDFKTFNFLVQQHENKEPTESSTT